MQVDQSNKKFKDKNKEEHGGSAVISTIAWGKNVDRNVKGVLVFERPRTLMQFFLRRTDEKFNKSNNI